MVTASGFIVLDEERTSVFTEDLSSYWKCFRQILIPRILDSRKIGLIYILIPKKIQTLYENCIEKISGKISLITYQNDEILEKILEIAKNNAIDEIIILNPRNLLISPEEIDWLLDIHRQKNRSYSFNHKQYLTNQYATGVGAEVIKTSYLISIKEKNNNLKNWADVHKHATFKMLTGIVRVQEKNAAPEINLSIESVNDYQKILQVIGYLQKRSPDSLWTLKEIFFAYRSLYSVRTVFLLEYSEDVQDAIDWAQYAGGVVDFISLSPLVTAFLDQKGISYSTREQFVNSNVVNTIGQQNYDKIRQLGLIFNPLLQNNRLKNYPFRVDYCLYNLKYLYDLLTISTYILSEIIRLKHPDSIRIFTHSTVKKTIWRYQFTNEDSVYAEVLSLPEWNVPITKLERINAPDFNPIAMRLSSNWLSSFLHNCLIRNSYLLNYGLIIKKNGVSALVKTVFHQVVNVRGYVVAIYGSGYNWDDCLPTLFESGIRQIHRIDISPNTGVCEDTECLFEAFTELITSDKSIRKSAMQDGIDLSSILFPRVIVLLTESWYRYRNAYVNSTNFFEKKHIQSLLLSVRSTPECHAIIASARNKSIPVISWQHGGLGYSYHPILVFLELEGSNIHLVFGECVKHSIIKTCQRFLYRSIPVIIPVGSSSLDLIKLNSSKSRRLFTENILYVTAFYEFNTWYVSMPYSADNYDERLWSFQKGIIDTVKSIGKNKLTIKLHPLHISKQPFGNYIRNKQYQEIDIIVNEKTIAELLDGSGILIYDLISTGILQGLRTCKEMFVYSGLMKVDDAAIKLLKKRAHVYETQEACYSALAHFLSGENLNDGVDCTNTEFLKCYGTYMNDGLSGKRAVVIVKNAINGNIITNE